MRSTGTSGRACWSPCTKSASAANFPSAAYHTNPQKAIPLTYKGAEVDCGYRLDVLVDGRVLVEIKSAEALAPVHKAQLLTYMRLLGVKVGLLVNFNVPVLKEGIRRFVL